MTSRIKVEIVPNRKSMESEERRTSSRASKKGGKHVKVQSAEEEARRREVVREKLRERLELEKRALQVVERLLEDSVAESFLLDCARFITAANYKDAVEERSITKLCGYPLCPNKLGKIPRQQYTISTKPNKVYDITERKCFCSNFCYKASKEFEVQISTTPLWLRQHESPPEIKLMKKGDIGSSGKEVLLTQRRLQEQDVDHPVNTQCEDPHEHAIATCHSDSSDDELEQDFISSVVSQQQRPRVHWRDLKSNEEKKEGRGKPVRVKKLTAEEDGEVQRHHGSFASETELGAEEAKQQLHKEIGVEEVTENLNSCSLHTEAASQQRHATTPTSSTITESTLQTEISLPVLTEMNTDNNASSNQPSLNIIQVGMTKRGAQGLRDLLKNHPHRPAVKRIGLNLLESLRATLKEWLTDETLKFLHCADHQLDSPPTNMKEEEEEELDEDDIEEEVTAGGRGGCVAGEQKKPTMPAPDFEMLKKETQQLGLKVKEFYNGTCVLPEKAEEMNGNEVDQSTSNTSLLPLVDSKAQHLIQKRITVEKLASCLKNIVGPLSLTLSDITSDLNNLVRTFRFTNTNIIHKTPEWTLIAVVILHLLSGVSPVIREALEAPSSVEHFNTLMEELGLQQQDLLNLLEMFKTPACLLLRLQYQDLQIRSLSFHSSGCRMRVQTNHTQDFPVKTTCGHAAYCSGPLSSGSLSHKGHSRRV
ncbi:putative RNA polymerase II subunit B1 CTD phosphatase rpap2 isoform X2 [Dunckerocampus dactyliophorus]|uniref:putative RNA polymerase II subunit B1 CTD phosphatase rpap2 isoform X2 n=1 Tax=Dunckerocampus dactyliophorus TaxID=161453 RepID=UPI0024069BE2|nr:putative RNA polymerase II subunit B1 CTD phosphatase rpap2 isoform X2 [Dunckerocampus dactyliophorus]